MKQITQFFLEGESPTLITFFMNQRYYNGYNYDTF